MFLFICFLHKHTTRNGLEGNIIHEIELGMIQLTFTTPQPASESNKES
jgi:hypothetical protein